jgi:hypothetical protein
MLYFYMGVAIFAGLGALVLLLPLNAIIAKIYNEAQTKKLKFSDTRIKIINEVLSGIKVIKLYGWGKYSEYFF